jgi:hypothetical protein
VHSKSSDAYENRFRDSRVLSGPRLIRDPRTGDTVTVMERRADGVAGARGPACLIFNTDVGFTRVWSYPANWAELSDAELVRLSESLRNSKMA